jgi:hypothetical protein
MSDWAKVDPARLADALHRKLAEATQQLADIQKADRPEFTNVDPGGAVNHFIASARGVCPVAETFGKQELPAGAFVSWRANWERQLSPDHLTLWNHMRVQREAREHGDGPALVFVEIPLPPSDYQPNAAIFGLRSRSRTYKGGVRFESYPDRSASDVCRDYLELCSKFVQDFLRDHAATIAARTK